jgi:myosin heavy subunit
MLEPVKLSLATFQPDKCYPPYLNTPRSLEACRMNGINPLELVELPFSEFQRDFPNDLDAARRRFERIDGARRRILENVTTDWKKLCDSKWKPAAKTRPRSAKETILVVNPQAHCQLLEIQAAKFRKIERDNWTELQRHLKVEIMKADQVVQNKKILQKHDELEEMHNEQQNERKMYLQELHREELMQRKMDEEEEMMEIKEEQKKFQEDILKHSRSEKERMKREKMRREERLIERYQRDKYTQQVKDSIMHGIDQKVDNRRKMSEMRLKNDEERVKEFFDRRGRERTEKMKELDSKIERVRSEKERISEENRKAVSFFFLLSLFSVFLINCFSFFQKVNDKIAEHERYRQQIEEQREKYKREVAPLEQNQSQEKLNKIRERTNNLTEDKSNRTLSALQLKEDIARRELEKVREAQERRRSIKSIRQEAHEIALRRAQKAEEYRMNKIKEDIKNKEERMSAIKQGFHVLDHMRNTMKDIMVKTDIELKEGLHRLKHIDEFSPDKVAIKAMEIGNQFLFPR